MRIVQRSILPILVVLSASVAGGAAVSDDRAADRADDRLVYVWSERMPLSVKGLPEAEAAAASLGVRFEPVELETAYARSALGGTLPYDVAGAAFHVPSTTLVTVGGRGQAELRTVLGYKSRAGLLRALEGAAVVVGVPPATRGERVVLSATDAGAGSEIARESRGDVRWTGEPEPGQPGFFYRMIPGTKQFVLDRRGRTYVHDTESGIRWRGPAELDLVPSPDATFLVAPLDRGLAFYSWDELRRVGPLGEGDALPPFHLDPDMDDQYPSVGILGDGGAGTHVRILVSWFAGVRIRDYTVSETADGGLAAIPRGDVEQPCPEVRLSTPILSPNGRRVSGRDESTATTKVFEIGPTGSDCTEIADVGTPTSKATFSPSSRYLAFSSWDSSGGRRRAQVRVMDLETGDVRPVPGATSTRLLIPDFGTEDEILILGVRDDTRFEIHCWRGTCPG